MNKPSSTPSYSVKLAGLAMSLMAASCGSDEIQLGSTQSADAYQSSADGHVRGQDASSLGTDSSDTQQGKDTTASKKTPVIVSCEAVQEKLNIVFSQIDAQCPINDAEIEGLDADLITRATKIIQNFQQALSGKNVSMKRYNSASTEGTLYLADENGTLDTKYMIDIYESDNEFVLNIGNTDLQMFFGKYKDTDGTEKLWLQKIRLAEEQDVCKPASNPYSVLTLILAEQGPAYGHMLSKDYDWATYSDVFPEQGTFTCNTKSQVIDCPTSAVNPWLSEKIAYECNPLEVTMEKSKIIPPENGFTLAQQVLDAAKPLVTEVMAKFSKDDSWKKLTWKANE